VFEQGALCEWLAATFNDINDYCVLEEVSRALALLSERDGDGGIFKTTSKAVLRSSLDAFAETLAHDLVDVCLSPINMSLL